jgi:hypothetical protein
VVVLVVVWRRWAGVVKVLGRLAAGRSARWERGMSVMVCVRVWERMCRW